MKKKVIIVLMILPFLISICAFVTSSFFIRKSQHDITAIEFDYKENEAFAIYDGKIKLEAEALVDKKYPLSDNNELIWYVEQLSNQEVATIEKQNDDYYLVPKHIGQVKVICSNQKKTVQNSFTATIYGTDGTITINPSKRFSSEGISKENYIGMYDLSYSEISQDSYSKVNYIFDFEINYIGGATSNGYKFEASNNLNVDFNLGQASLISTGPAYIQITNLTTPSLTSKIEFNIVDGVNIYNYSDLLIATNFSSNGETVVQRVNLESLENTYDIETDPTTNQKSYIKRNEYTELFGTYDFKYEFFNFENEIYKFETNFDSSFIDLWNEYVDKHDYFYKIKKLDKLVNVGIRIQKDFYGNGFRINSHNLTYPYDERHITVDGVETIYPLLDDYNLFRGPKILFSLGYPSTPAINVLPSEPYPIFALYGQDNISFYLDGDNITIDNVHFRGCDFGDNFNNLEYTGTVLEVYGNNNTIKNSIIENGRNVIRAYSSLNLNIDNCLINNAMEFLVRIGSFEGEKVDPNKQITYTFKGNSYQTTTSSYLEPILQEGLGNDILTYGAVSNTPAYQFLGLEDKEYSKQDYMNGKNAVHDALTNTKNMINEDGSKNYHSTVNINDTFFQSSGISSIMLDSSPNGSYIYNNTTTLFTSLLGGYIPIDIENMGQTSYPSKLKLTGDCRFYDWKDTSALSFSSLIYQNIDLLINEHGGVGDITSNITEKDYLPLKYLLETNYNDKFIKEDNLSYINIPIFKMGGGSNLSDVYFDENLSKYFLSPIEIDPYEYSLDLSTPDVDDFNDNPKSKYETMKICMLRAASNVIGFENYKFYSLNPSLQTWYKQSANITDLTNHIE